MQISICVSHRIIHRHTLDEQRLRVQDIRIGAYLIRAFCLQRTQLLKDRVLGIQLQNTLCVYALTAVDSSLLVEHLLHLERYRAFGTPGSTDGS